MKVEKRKILKKRKNPLLSICIPTYNREKFLDEAIGSVVNKITKNYKSEVELCISDNASTDATDKLVKRWKRNSCINIVYHKNLKNLGVDRNFLKVIDIANGKYCWFLGSDDVIEKEGIKKVIEKIKENHEIDLFILTQSNYDFHLKNKIPDSYPLPKKFNTNIKFRNSFEAISHAGYALGFISVLVFNREKWLKIKGDNKFIGSGYIQR